VRDALDQRQQPHLRMAGAPGTAEGLGVGRGVGGVDAGAVPGHDPPAERDRPSSSPIIVS